MNNGKPKTPQEIVASLLDPVAYEEEQKKKAKKPPQVIEKKAEFKEKKYFDIRVESMLPAILSYRILAEDAYQALELIKGKTPNSIQHKLIGKRDIIAKVYDSGSCIIRHIKKFIG
jgi:hypothetical protein